MNWDRRRLLTGVGAIALSKAVPGDAGAQGVGTENLTTEEQFDRAFMAEEMRTGELLIECEFKDISKATQKELNSDTREIKISWEACKELLHIKKKFDALGARGLSPRSPEDIKLSNESLVQIRILNQALEAVQYKSRKEYQDLIRYLADFLSTKYSPSCIS